MMMKKMSRGRRDKRQETRGKDRMQATGEETRGGGIKGERAEIDQKGWWRESCDVICRKRFFLLIDTRALLSALLASRFPGLEKNKTHGQQHREPCSRAHLTCNHPTLTTTGTINRRPAAILLHPFLANSYCTIIFRVGLLR